MKPDVLAGAHRVLAALVLVCGNFDSAAQNAPASAGQVADMALRKQEIAQCLPGEISTWADGNDRAALAPALTFVYDNRGAPVWFERPVVMEALQRAAAAWSECGVPARVVAQADAAAAAVGAIRVQWSQAGSRNNFGLADPGGRTLWLGPGAFLMLQKVNPQAGPATLQMVLSHEMGHFFGLMAHSRRCVDVTSYYTDAQGQRCRVRGGANMPMGVEYRAQLPTACDIARCRALNPHASADTD